MPRGTAEQTRETILTVADSLFYARGIKDVSLDQIAERAGVTKKTVYYHFASKEKLVTAYLVQRDENTLRWLINAAEKGGDEPADQISTLFDVLAKWSQSSIFHGCPFVRSAGDLIKEPAHEALAVGLVHKTKYLMWLTKLATRAGADNPDLMGRQLLVLIDGAISETLVTKDPVYFESAKQAALQIMLTTSD